MIQCYSSQFVPLLRFYYHIVSLCRFEICSYMTSPWIAFFFLSILDSLFCQCEYNMKWTIDCLCILEVPLSRAFSHYCLFTMITVGSHYTLLNIVCLAWTVVFVSCLVQDKNIIMIERYHYFAPSNRQFSCTIETLSDARQDERDVMVLWYYFKCPEAYTHDFLLFGCYPKNTYVPQFIVLRSFCCCALTSLGVVLFSCWNAL